MIHILKPQGIYGSSVECFSRMPEDQVSQIELRLCLLYPLVSRSPWKGVLLQVRIRLGHHLVGFSILKHPP